MAGTPALWMSGSQIWMQTWACWLPPDPTMTSQSSTQLKQRHVYAQDVRIWLIIKLLLVTKLCKFVRTAKRRQVNSHHSWSKAFPRWSFWLKSYKNLFTTIMFENSQVWVESRCKSLKSTEINMWMWINICCRLYFTVTYIKTLDNILWSNW